MDLSKMLVKFCTEKLAFKSSVPRERTDFPKWGSAERGARFSRPRRLRKFRKILRHKVHRVHLPGAAIETVQGSGVGGEAERQFIGVQGLAWRP